MTDVITKGKLVNHEDTLFVLLQLAAFLKKDKIMLFTCHNLSKLSFLRSLMNLTLTNNCQLYRVGQIGRMCSY